MPFGPSAECLSLDRYLRRSLQLCHAPNLVAAIKTDCVQSETSVTSTRYSRKLSFNFHPCVFAIEHQYYREEKAIIYLAMAYMYIFLL